MEISNKHIKKNYQNNNTDMGNTLEVIVPSNEHIGHAPVVSL